MKFSNRPNKVYENLFKKQTVDSFLNQRHKEQETIYLVPFHFEDIGTVNTTEIGMISNEYEINDFTSYAKLITGINNIQDKWDDASNVYIDEEANKDLPDDEKFMTKEYKVGGK